MASRPTVALVREPGENFARGITGAGLGALVTRPGDPSRRGEAAAVAAVLARHRPLVHIRPPGRLDGGDVLRVGGHVYIGRSTRTNREGAEQLAEIVADQGLTSSPVMVDEVLHLKTGVTGLGDGRLLATAGMAARFPSAEVITVPDDEAYAANCLPIPGHLLVPAGSPRTQRRLLDLGYRVAAVEMSEFRKMDGGLTCLSLIW
ncbi:MAG: hypothetical protein P8188_09450 [Gemmatimonadota bacterium]